jgi:hypothetical protein
MADRAKLDDERTRSVVREQVERIKDVWPSMENWLTRQDDGFSGRRQVTRLAQFIATRLEQLPLFQKAR